MDKIIGFHLGIGTVYPPKWVETPTKHLLDWGLHWRREREMYHPPLSRCITDVYLIQSIGSVAKM